VPVKEIKILGLDPGLAILGFGTIICRQSTLINTEASSIRLEDFGVIQTQAQTPLGDRLCMIYEDLHTIVAEINPDLVAIEKLFFYRMSHTITVAQARGVLMLVLGQANLPEVQTAVARELELDAIPRPDDADDALAIAITAWFHQDI